MEEYYDLRFGQPIPIDDKDLDIELGRRNDELDEMVHVPFVPGKVAEKHRYVP